MNIDKKLQSNDLLPEDSSSVDTRERFQFGKNWFDYSTLIDDVKISEACERLESFVGEGSLKGKTFLDIGSGSGLHSLAALQLGATKVLAIDLDSNSIKTTKYVLDKFWGKSGYTVREQSVFDLDPVQDGLFDIVYSWGVLHHTGEMVRAICNACAMVQTNGLLAIALYGKTRYCGTWTKIKRWYVNASLEQQVKVEQWYIKLFGIYLLLRGKRLSKHIASYNKKRGMDFYHDVRDWVGGYPYESICSDELYALVQPLGFKLLHEKVKRRSGLFGSGNDEYLLQRTTSTTTTSSSCDI